MKNIFLIEDHDEALGIWRRQGIRDLDLVHIDAHMDFGRHQAQSVDQLIRQVKSLAELKAGLEANIAYKQYASDFDRQTNIGNYIYPAMREGIVRDFYWVIPGDAREFERSASSLRKLLTSSTFHLTGIRYGGRYLTGELFGRKFIACSLDSLPIFRRKVLLDIDTDYLVIPSIRAASPTIDIGKRKSWILAKELAGKLNPRIKRPAITTIAYSVNGGFTPIIYKHLGDEIAYLLSPGKFLRRYQKNRLAADYFSKFNSTGNKGCYQRAVKLNSTYRAADNNYGFLKLAIGKLAAAKKEFLRIQRVDPRNANCLAGLGNIALASKDFARAKNYFTNALALPESEMFSKSRKQSLFGLAKAEFHLSNLPRAKVLLTRYKRQDPFYHQTYYLLARVFEKERNFTKAVSCYQDAIRLGLNSIEPLWRLLKISSRLKIKDDIMKYVAIKYSKFKREFSRVKHTRLKAGKNIRNTDKTKRMMHSIEKMINTLIWGEDEK